MIERNLIFELRPNNDKMGLYWEPGSFMRTKIIAGGVVAVLFGAGIGESAYVIKLRNGNEYITERYWHKGAQVLFDTYGGVFGVDKRFIAKIEKTDKPVRLIAAEPPSPELKSVEDSVKNSGEGKKETTETQEQVLSKRNEDDPILRHFQIFKERAKHIDGMLTSELTQLIKDLEDLKRAMQLSGKTNDFLAEFGELHDLGDRLEEALKGRR